MPDDFDYSARVVRDRAKGEALPLLTILLITLCVVLTALFHLAPDDKSNGLYKLAHTVLLSPNQIWSGRFLGLFTSFFIHLDLLHLAFNMYWIWQMGSILERTIPAWKYLLFLVTATMVGSCCELLISSQTGAGASGAGYALMGLLWTGRGYHDSWRQIATRQNLQTFLVWGALCIILTITGTFNVANGAHFGGLLFGFAIGHLCFSPRRKPIWITALVFLAGVCVVSLTWMPWSSSWNWYKASQAFDRNRYEAAITYYERALRTGGERAGLLYNIALARYRITKIAQDKDRPEDIRRAMSQFTQAIDAAKAAAPPPSNTNDPTGNDDLNRLDELKTELEKTPAPVK
jgi:membrane associated rhomboid family serine protease